MDTEKNHVVGGDGYDPEVETGYPHEVPLDAIPKSRWERSWPTIACGAGLFSDGYLNGVCDLSSKVILEYMLIIIAIRSLDP